MACSLSLPLQLLHLPKNTNLQDCEHAAKDKDFFRSRVDLASECFDLLISRSRPKERICNHSINVLSSDYIDRSKMQQKSVVLYRISDLILRSRIEQIAYNRGFRVINASSIKNLPPIKDFFLVCDLVIVQNEIENLVEDTRLARATIVGFYPHVNKVLKVQAISAGVKHVVPRSALESSLKNLFSNSP